MAKETKSGDIYQSLEEMCSAVDSLVRSTDIEYDMWVSNLALFSDGAKSLEIHEEMLKTRLDISRERKNILKKIQNTLMVIRHANKTPQIARDFEDLLG